MGTLTLIVGLGAVPLGCWAASPIGSGNPRETAGPLASLAALSDTAMAGQTGTGVASPTITTEQTLRAPIVLWDELRIVRQMTPGMGTSTITEGTGVGK